MQKVCFLLLLLLCGQWAQSAEGSLIGKIKHVVVLMLENRSFDHMAGFLKAQNPSIEGCLPNGGKACSNPMDPTDPSSPTVTVDNLAVYHTAPDPDHSISGTLRQIYGYGKETEPCPMTGFIKSYQQEHSATPGDIMHCFDPANVPVFATLANEFAIFDGWHASVPGPTEVNRLYANSATSHGMGINDDVLLALGLPQKTLFEQLDTAGLSWRSYFEFFPTTLFFTYPRAEAHLKKFKDLLSFVTDCAAGDLPTYSWLEPQYYDVLGTPANDQHPDHDVGEGDRLIKVVYESLRASPLWNQTLLLVTYDEHGGFFDHVSPPKCPSPDGLNATDDPFDFTRLGVRVPTLAISPWINKGLVVHSPPHDGQFEHSSIPATMKKMFYPSQPFLTKRDAWAATFEAVFPDRDTPRTDCPTTVPEPVSHRAYGNIPELNGNQPLSGFQRTMVAVASGLNNRGAVQPIDEHMTEQQAAEYLSSQTNAFLRSEVAAVRKPTQTVTVGEPRAVDLVSSH